MHSFVHANTDKCPFARTHDADTSVNWWRDVREKMKEFIMQDARNLSFGPEKVGFQFLGFLVRRGHVPK